MMMLTPLFQWHKDVVEFRRKKIKEIHETLKDVHNKEVKFVKEGVKKEKENKDI